MIIYRILSVIFCFFFTCNLVTASDGINIPIGWTHEETKNQAPCVPIDQPDVYIDSDELSLTFVGWDNTLSYYDIEVTDSNGHIVVSTLIGGYGSNTIYLPYTICSGIAHIDIVSSVGNEYEGDFVVP